jgi:hypothetical protein
MTDRVPHTHRRLLVRTFAFVSDNSPNHTAFSVDNTLMDISVIVASSTWQPGIAPMLERLARQQFASERYEVLLACPLTSEDAIAAEHAWTRAGGSRGGTLRFVQPGLTAPATWMHYANAALTTAGGKYSLFLQPGLLAEPELLAAHVRSHAALAGSGVSCVTGRVLCQMSEKRTLWSAMLDRWCRSLHRPDRPEADPIDAAHLSVPTEALRRVGGLTNFATADAEVFADMVCKLRARTGVTVLEQPDAKAWLERVPSPTQTLHRDFNRGWASLHMWHTSNLWRSAWSPAQLDDDEAGLHLRKAIENDSVVCEKMIGWFQQLDARSVHADESLAEELAHDAWERSLTLRRWAYRRGVLAAMERAGDRPGVFVASVESSFSSFLSVLPLAA